MNGFDEHGGQNGPTTGAPAVASPSVAAPTGPAAAANAWHEYRSADGRVYYHNSVTNATQWTKPEEMMTPVERALTKQPWKEYTAEGGRKYWYNTETKQSSWEMPDVYKTALGLDATPTTPATPNIPTGPAAQNHFHPQRDYHRGGYQRDNRENGYPSDNWQSGGGSGDASAAAVPLAPGLVPTNSDNVPEYANPEDAEAAFMKLLRRSGVQPDWTWEQALRAIVRDPHYRAIRDTKDRKAAFEKYRVDVVTQDKERAKERLAKLRADFTAMLQSHPEIKHYTHWRTARPILEGEAVFRSTDNEAERRQLFDDYIDELRRAHRAQKTQAHKAAVDTLVELLPNLNLAPYTRWADARPLLEATPLLQAEREAREPRLTKLDALTAFQNHMKGVERAFNDSRQQEKTRKLRRERKNREAFVALLGELARDGKIKASSKWSQVYPLFAADDRYLAMVGQSGSTPQELFWDLVDQEQRALRGTRNDVNDVLDDRRFEITPKTTFDSFFAVMRDDRRTANIDREVLALIFERLHEKTKEKRSDEDRQAERQQRRALDDFRAFLKRLDPPLTAADASYEKVKPRLLKSEAFQAIASDEARQAAFDRFIRRLQDRDDEADRDRERERERERRDRDRLKSRRGGDRLSVDRSRDRERDRDRDRDRDWDRSRGGDRSVRRRTRSRSPAPEADTYEADRRRAVAERERNYRRPSVTDSADVKERDVRERDRDHDRLRDRDRERDRLRTADRHRDRDRERDRERDRDRYRDRERDRGDRDRERDREPDRNRLRGHSATPSAATLSGSVVGAPSAGAAESHYDRERRDREEERERLYRRRLADHTPSELNYGDEKPPSVRRRRADEGESRESKRPRRDAPSEERTSQHEASRPRSAAAPGSGTAPAASTADGPSAKPAAAAAAEKATATTATTAGSAGKATTATGAVRSGSEEGEIEED